MHIWRLALVMAWLIGLADADAAVPGVGAEAELLALHKEVMDAHLEGDVELLLRAEGEEYVVANRGEITHPSREERRARLGPYLQHTRYPVYRDLVPPIVEISADGSLGWVVVQIEARGERINEDGSTAPVEFVSAWIELYRKEDGKWLRIGNVSNFRPGP